MVAIVFIGGHYAGLGKYTEKYVAMILNPMERSFGFLANGLADFFSFYLTKDDYISKNEELRMELTKLARENIALREKSEENELLRAKLNFFDNEDYPYTVARVLGRSLNYETQDVLIDKGAIDGIRNGLAVTTGEGIMIGKIVKVEENFSHVRLLQDNRSRVAVVVAAKQSNLGVAHGEHNMSVKIDMLPKESEIKEGDMVGTSGLEIDIPRGLLVGEIVQIIRGEESLWQEALIKPAADYSQVRIVTVILPVN